MKQDFKYRIDKRTRRITWIISSLILLVVLFFVFYSRSGYFPTWFVIFVATILLLYVLSIPRRVRITDEALEIHCLVELTSISLKDIAVIRKMEPDEMKFSLPLLGSYGFFGYYGWFYNLSEFSLFKVYASQWKDFVRIEDIYETTYVVNCDDPDALVAALLKAKEEYVKSRKEAECTVNKKDTTDVSATESTSSNPDTRSKKAIQQLNLFSENTIPPPNPCPQPIEGISVKERE